MTGSFGRISADVSIPRFRPLCGAKSMDDACSWVDLPYCRFLGGPGSHRDDGPAVFSTAPGLVNGLSGACRCRVERLCGAQVTGLTRVPDENPADIPADLDARAVRLA